MSKGLKLIIVGVGGQGILTVSEILGIAAMDAGLPAVMSEVHGMAQRGGVVTTEVKIGAFHSPLIGDGEADIILGFEPAETYRLLNKASRKTRIVTNIEPLVPPSVSIGQGKYPPVPELIENMKKSGLVVIPIKAMEMAKEAGDMRVGNVIMLGATASVDNFILSRESLLKALSSKISKGGKTDPKLLALNEKAFEMGYAIGKKYQ
jgi:indolepyruvate ferredoxin oxidoreductase beta subunit